MQIISEDLDKEFISITIDKCLSLLSDPEVRVRMAAGEVLGTLCKAVGTEVYESAKDHVLSLIRQNRERQDEVKDHEVKAKLSAEAVFHDTAGWKNLESSMKCLQAMTDGCGDRFREYVDKDLIELVFASLSHTNRFVRETGFQTLTSIIQACKGEDDRLNDTFAGPVGQGMTDNWSQVRLASSIACRTFLELCPDEAKKEKYFPTLLPKLCLNRYYMAEGVKLYCQETWKRTMGANGKRYVEKYIDQVVEYYIECTRADNHAVREAACHCIAELAAKIDKAVLKPKVQTLLQTLLICFQDDSWPVRDTACVACGKFVQAYPAECKDKLEVLWQLFMTNLKDPISSVRQGAAMAMGYAVEMYPDVLFDRVKSLIKDGLNDLRNQQAESERYTEMDTGLTEFGVAKKIRDNDISLHENQPMYSCGSLAPKMGRGGCSDSRFKKPSEPWEFADGCVHLFAELCSISILAPKLHPILGSIAMACGHKHYTLHHSFLETVLKRIPDMATHLGKRNFKPYLDEFWEPIFYALDGENALASVAAERAVQFLSGYLGPNILRGRVEQYGARYLTSLDKCLDSEGGGVMSTEPMDVDPIPMGSMAMAIPTRRRDNDQQPHLGGTPT